MSTKAAPKTSKQKKADAVLDASQQMDASTVVAEIGALQVSLQTTLAGVTASITEKIEKNRQMDEAIALKEARINELHGIEKEALQLEEVKLRRLQEEADLKTSRDATLKQWAEQDAQRAQQVKREQEEYDYKVKTERTRQTEEFAAEVARLKRVEALHEEELKRNWTQREVELQSKESEVTELRAKVASFDETLKAAVSKAEAIVGNTLKREYDNQAKLLQKDIEAEKNLHAAQIDSLNGKITGLTSQIATLQTQLEEARKDAKEVTAAALQSASGRDVTNALQKAMETNSTNTKK